MQLHRKAHFQHEEVLLGAKVLSWAPDIQVRQELTPTFMLGLYEKLYFCLRVNK